MLARLKKFGSLIGHDLTKTLTRATEVREAKGARAALDVLREELGDRREKAGSRNLDPYVRCWLLVARCQVEAGVQSQDPALLETGLRSFLGLVKDHFSHFQLTGSLLAESLEWAEASLRQALEVPTGFAAQSGVFLEPVCEIASLWNQLNQARRGMGVCQWGLELFAEDPRLMLVRAEAQAGLGQWSESLDALRCAIRGRNEILRPGMLAQLLTQAQTATDPALADLAAALAAELYHRLARWDQAYESGQKAVERLGDRIEESTAEAWLATLAQSGRAEEFIRNLLRFLPRLSDPAVLANLVRRAQVLLEKRSRHASLHAATGGLHLRAGASAAAVAAFREARLRDPDAGPEIVRWFEAAGAHESADPVLCLGLAEMLLQGMESGEGLAVLKRLAGGSASSAQLEEALRLANRVLARVPEDLVALDCTGWLLLRSGQLDEALALARRMLSLPDSTAQVAALCGEVGSEAQLRGRDATGLAALQLKIDLHLRNREVAAGLGGVQSLSQHPAATLEHLLWAAERLRRMVGEPGIGATARVLLGDLLTRLVSPREAAEHYTAVVMAGTEPRLLERACAGLARVWAKAPEPGRARAVLAGGWMRLGRPAEAREALLFCAAKHPVESVALLDDLRERALAAEPEAGWLALSFEAELVLGDEQRLAGLADAATALVDRNAGFARQADQFAAGLLEKSRRPGTRQAARLAQVRARVAVEDFETLAVAVTAAVKDQPELKPALLDTLATAAGALAPTGKAAVRLVIAGLLSNGSAQEAEEAIQHLAEAARLDPEGCAERVVTETLRIALREDGYPGAVLTALRLAIQRRQGAALSADLLRLLDKLTPPQLEEARPLLAEILEATPDLPPVLLAAARCESRLGQPAAALVLYHRVCTLRVASFVELAIADLQAMQAAAPRDPVRFLAFVDALLSAGQVGAARPRLLARIAEVPADVAPCLDRLQSLRQRSDRTWEDDANWAEGLRLAGQAEAAVPIWDEILRSDAVDLAACHRGLEQLCVALPGHFGAASLLVRAEARRCAPDRLAALLGRVAQLLATADKPPLFLRNLIEDCTLIEQRARGAEPVLKLAALRHAEILAALGEHVSAADALDQWLRRWPAEATKVAGLCGSLGGVAAEPVYRGPFARASFLQRDWEAGARALRTLITAAPERQDQARRLCEEFLAQAPAAGRGPLGLLLSELAALRGDAASAARLYLRLAAEAPELRPATGERLRALLAGNPAEPEVHLALAEFELNGDAANIGAAFTVLEGFWEARGQASLPVLTAFASRLAERFPRELEPRLRLIWVHLRAPATAAAVGAETRRLFAEFGEEGTRRFLEFCEREQVLQCGPAVMLELECEGHERFGNIPRCLACLEALVQRDPATHAVPARDRAEGYHRAGLAPEAVVPFLAGLALRTGDLARAATLYAEAVELPGTDLAKTRAGLESVLQAAGAEPVALGGLARCEWKAGRSAAAARCYRRAAQAGATADLSAPVRALCEAFPDEPLGWFVLGELLFARQAPAEAQAALESALAGTTLGREEQIAAGKMLAECLARQHRFDDAIDGVRKVLELAPDDDEAARRVISLYFERNEHQVGLARRRLEEEGETPESLVEFGELLSARGDYAEAVGWFRKVPRDSALASRARLATGKCHLALNQCHLAVTSFQAALQGQPPVDEQREALYQMGIAHARLLEFPRAVEAFEALCREDAGYRDAADQLRRCSQQLHGGQPLRTAEVQFDLVSEWRRLATPPAAVAVGGAG